jgi:hypothetical protein
MNMASIKRLSIATALVAGLTLSTAASAEPRWSEDAAIGAGLAVGPTAAPYDGYYDYASGPLYPALYYDMTPGWANGWNGQPYPPGCGAGRPHC